MAAVGKTGLSAGALYLLTKLNGFGIFISTSSLNAKFRVNLPLTLTGGSSTTV